MTVAHDPDTTAMVAYLTARVLAGDGHTDPDAVTHADIDTAADIAGVDRPTSSDDWHTVRAALEAIAGQPQTDEAAERLRKLHADCRADYEAARWWRDGNSNRRRFW